MFLVMVGDDSDVLQVCRFRCVLDDMITLSSAISVIWMLCPEHCMCVGVGVGVGVCVWGCEGVGVCGCVFACVCAYARACACVCVCMCM